MQNLKSWINTNNVNTDGSIDCLVTSNVEIKVKRLWWQLANLSYTTTGCGSRIPTRYMIKYCGKWRRVYCCIYSNSGTLFIGRRYDGSNTVRIDNY